MSTQKKIEDKDEVFEAFTGQLRHRLGRHLKKTILFGSRARGDHRRDSDYDFLVVVDDVTHAIKNAVYDIAGEILYRNNSVVFGLPISETEYNQRIHDPLLKNIRNEGISCD